MMHDDKEILIIDPEELELELHSDSPYCTTTTELSRGKFQENSSGQHKKIYIPAFRQSRNKFKFQWRSSRELTQRISTISFATKKGHEAGEICPVLTARLRRCGKLLSEIWYFHWRMVLSSGLTVISAAGSLISFPLHLEGLTEAGEGGSGSDGYSACFAISTILVILFLLTSLGVKLVYWGSRAGERGFGEAEDYDEDEMRVVTVITPCISWRNILKIGCSVGLCVLSLCSAWEDKKVRCNYQDPLLGIVIIFAIITYSVSKWRHFGFKRAFALLSVAAGVFVSVIYMLLDEHRCRGVYYPFPVKDIWSWKVHLVWTLAFVIAIWLWTVAMFCLESAVPFPTTKSCRGQVNEYNAVKMSVLRVKNGGQSSLTASRAVIEALTPQSECVEPTCVTSFRKPTPRRKYFSPYSKISYVHVFNSVLWFQIAAWAFIASLFWTEFVPGFGIGKNLESPPSLLTVIRLSFDKCFHDGCSWWLIIALFVYSQSFTYVILLTRSSLLAICITCFGFPIIGIWWSVVQVNQNMFLWMPAYSGELLCSILGLPLIFAGTLYLFKLDILNGNRDV